MDFTESLLDPEGEELMHDETSTNEEGVLVSNKEPLTFQKVARECLMGTCGNKELDTQEKVIERYDLHMKILLNPEDCQLLPKESELLKSLVVIRFPVNAAAQLLKKL